MKKKLSFFSVFFLASVICSFLFVLPGYALAQDTYGLNSTANQVTAYNSQVSQNNQFYSGFLQTKVGQIVGLVLSFVGVIFLILMIYAGILWMTAQGNTQQVDKAKSLLVNAVIGLIIVLAAYAITSFIGSEIINR